MLCIQVDAENCATIRKIDAGNILGMSIFEKKIALNFT